MNYWFQLQDVMDDIQSAIDEEQRLNEIYDKELQDTFEAMI